MERAEIQVVWIPSPRKSSCIFLSDDEDDSNRSANIYSTMSAVRNVVLKGSHEESPEVKTGSDPVDIRYFHYPDQQQIELENMLHDLFKIWEARARRSWKLDIRQHCPSITYALRTKHL